MGVDRAGEVFGAAAVFHVGDDFGEEFAGVAAKDLGAEDFVGRGVGDDFHKAIGGIGGDGAAVGGEVEFADIYFDALGLGGVFAEPDGGDFGIGVDDGGNEVPIDVTGFAGDPLGDGNAVFLGFMGEHGTVDDVADGPDAGDVGLEVGVDLDAFFVGEGDAGGFEAEVVGVGAAADGDEHDIGGELEGLAVALGGEGFGLGVEAGDLGVYLDGEALFLEDAGEVAGDIRIAGPADGGKEFDDGDLGTEAGPDGAEFEADGAAAHDHEFPGDFGEVDGVIGRDDGLGVEFKEGELDRRGAGGDDDVFGGEFLIADGEFGGGGELGFAGDNGDLAGFGELGDAAGEFGDDGVLLFQHGREIDFEIGEREAVVGGVMASEGDVLGGVEEGLARDAADVEAGAAEGGSFVDEGDLEAELGGAESADVAAGAGADDNEIEGGGSGHEVDEKVERSGRGMK